MVWEGGVYYGSKSVSWEDDVKKSESMLSSSRRRRQVLFERELTDNGCSLRMWNFFDAETSS